MKPIENPNTARRRRKGLALITVISMIALATVLLLAFLTTADSELNSTRVSADGDAARRLADDAVAVVIGQLQAASRQDEQNPGREFHATQPGVVRKYSDTGLFLKGYKLYSDSKMVETASGTGGEINLANDEPPGDWDTKSDNNHARYVDLNAPVVRARYGNTDRGAGITEVIFPIIDPRAAADDTSTSHNDAVEGFQYYPQLKLGNGRNLNGVVSGGGSPDSLRLPMPVEWIYVLKNGTTGTLDDSLRFQSAVDGSDGRPSADNPIVGRIAFWGDDESCKINVNTASEPTFWQTPHFYSDRDKNWNDCPPAKYEYQRFPGHPATVALSAVLFPNVNLNLYGHQSPEMAIAMREAIYNLTPKINNGGSKSGTMPFDSDSFDTKKASPITVADVTSAMSEPLFVSLDEMRFTDKTQNHARVPTSLKMPSGQELLTPNFLEKSRFFLTANSRSPDFSIMGVPRIAVWPLPHRSLGTNYRTVQDNMIEFCSTLKTLNGPALYAIQRRSPLSQLEDTQDDRNRQLLDYLYAMLLKIWPGNSSGGGKSFYAKYGEDETRQIIIEMFDYIRCTNLYDSQLSMESIELQNDPNPVNGKFNNPNFEEGRKQHVAKNWTLLYEYRDKMRSERAFRTFTDPHYKLKRLGDEREPVNTDFPANLQWEVLANGFPGHGQVSPARWSVNGADYQGFGRNITVSEAALHFICTADGKNDHGSYRIWNPGFNGKSQDEGDRSGGRTAPRTDYYFDYTPNTEYRVPQLSMPSQAPKEDAYWYSNYPPFPAFGNYGTSGDKNDTGPRGMRGHPGYNPSNWNTTLDDDTPLNRDERRIQLMIQLELFCPSVGWTGFDPEFTIVMDNKTVSGIEIEGTSVYSTTTDLVVKSGRPLYGTSNGNNSTGMSVPRYDVNAHRVGGTGDFRSLIDGRRSKPIGRTDDPQYDSSASARVHGKLLNLDLMSNFKTVKSDEFTFQVKEPIKLRIYDTHDWQRKDPIQEVEIKFPDGPKKALTPSLATISSPHRIIIDPNTGNRTWYYACQAPRWWVFNYTGCVDVYSGSAAQYVTRPGSIVKKSETQLLQFGTGGRLRTTGTFSDIRGDSHTVSEFKLPLKYYDLNNSNVVTVSVSHGARVIWGVSENQMNGGTWPLAEKFYLQNNTRINRLFLDSPESSTKNFGFDIIRSVMPRWGDYRLMAAKRRVTQEMWVEHPLWTKDGTNDVIMAHNLSAHNSNFEVGFDQTGQTMDPGGTRPNRGVPNDFSKLRLTPGADYQVNQIPDFPMSQESVTAANRYRDWDNAVGNTRDGAYINKPDEGNFCKLPFYLNKSFVEMRNAYLFDTMESSQGAPSYFTPNRMIPSPAMFGSLPTGVRRNIPWQTLLFRPDPNANSADSHPGAQSPADHYLLDLFQMPVVEPYAISEPTSVIGRINVNHQILPFTHIKRATGLHALLKGELMPAVATVDAPYYKTDVNLALSKGGLDDIPEVYWSENTIDPRATNTNVNGIGPLQQAKRSFYRTINAEQTIRQLDERFYNLGNVSAAKVGLLRAPGQICEIHLIPKDIPTDVVAPPGANVPASFDEATRSSNMKAFWNIYGLTGDNMKERPYANILSKITTRSNTFRVFVRAQTLRKARSSDVDVFDPEKDSVVAEFRGTRLLERYIDPSGGGSTIEDYAATGDPYKPKPLDEFYRFRILESKRFDP